MGNQNSPMQEKENRNTGTQSRKRRRKAQVFPEAAGEKAGLSLIIEQSTAVCAALSALLAVILLVLVLCGLGFWEAPLTGLVSAIYLLLATAFYGATKHQKISRKKRRACFWSLLAAYAAFLLHSGFALVLVLALF